MSEMTTVTFDVPSSVYHDVEELASKSERKPAEVLREAVESFLRGSKPSEKRMSLVEIKPALNSGTILKPWTSRAELLEDYFDDRD
jgi:hypothetical protein